MEIKKELFVYYDPEYDPDCTSKFISRTVSESIVEFLRHREFQVLNALELQEVMLSVVREERLKATIVFAQDVAPDTVLTDFSAAALVRQFLDCGGTIVWPGDIPFYYQARRNGKDRDDKWWQKGAPADILNVNPVFAYQIAKTGITSSGRTKGLTETWTGVRPVLIDRNLEVLAEAECALGGSYRPIPRCWFSRRIDQLCGLNVSAARLHVGVELEGGAKPEEGNILRNKKLANSWFKNFDRDKPYSGFYRIWDYSLFTLSNHQFENLYHIATVGEP